jgi:hypothetical protein
VGPVGLIGQAVACGPVCEDRLVPSADTDDHTFRERVLAVHGLGALARLDDLPGVAERWRRYWALGPLRPYSLNYNWVAAADRVEPGQPLATIVPERDDEACDAIATVAVAVRRPATAGLPALTDRVADLTRHRDAHPGDRDPLPPGVVAEAEHLGAELLHTAPPDVLLHGDLHHDNVLCAANRARPPKSTLATQRYGCLSLS